MRHRHGFTLIEVALALTLGALILGIAVPGAVHVRNVLAVRAAATELAGLVALTRAAAITARGATLVVDAASGTAWIETAAGTTAQLRHVARRHRVRVRADRTSPVRIRYDALGIGRFAAATLRVESGRVSSAITISAYGRVRT